MAAAPTPFTLATFVGAAALLGSLPPAHIGGGAAVGAGLVGTARAAEETPPPAARGRLKVKGPAGEDAYFVRPSERGAARLLDGAGSELARYTPGKQGKIEVRDDAGAVLGWVRPGRAGQGDRVSLRDPSQEVDLFVLRPRGEGRYDLQDGAGRRLYAVKQRDYGWKVEGPDGAERFKVKVKDGKTTLRDAADATLSSTNDPVAALAFVALGFDELSPAQRFGLLLCLDATR